MKKRIAALLLCLVMAMSLIPTTALAAGLGVQSAEDGISAAVDADQQAVKDEPTDEGKAPEQEVVQPAVEEPTDEEKTPEQPVNQPVENEEENNTAAPQNGLLDAEGEDAGVSVQANGREDFHAEARAYLLVYDPETYSAPGYSNSTKPPFTFKNFKGPTTTTDGVIKSWDWSVKFGKYYQAKGYSKYSQSNKYTVPFAHPSELWNYDSSEYEFMGVTNTLTPSSPDSCQLKPSDFTNGVALWDGVNANSGHVYAYVFKKTDSGSGGGGTDPTPDPGPDPVTPAEEPNTKARAIVVYVDANKKIVNPNAYSGQIDIYCSKTSNGHTHASMCEVSKLWIHPSRLSVTKSVPNTYTWIGWYHSSSLSTNPNAWESTFDVNDKTIFSYSNKLGSAQRYIYLIYQEPTVTPNKPTVGDVAGLVNVNCVTEDAANNPKWTGGLLGTEGTDFTIGAVQGNASSGYTSTITIKNVGLYVDQVNTSADPHEEASNHDLTIKLKYNTTKKTWDPDASNPDATIYVKCDQSTRINPPDDDFLQGIDGLVKVHCTTEDAANNPKWSGKLVAESYDVKVNQIDKTCVVIITDYTPYVNNVAKHTVDKDAAQDERIGFKYNGTEWVLEQLNADAKLYVKCVPVTKPTDDPDYNTFGDLVNVICDSTVNHSNKNKSYPVEDLGVVKDATAGTPKVEEVTDNTGKVTGYKWVVTIDKDYYVDKYNTNVPNHTYKQDSSKEDLTIQFNWDGSTWTVDNNNDTATVYVECTATLPTDADLANITVRVTDESTVHGFKNSALKTGSYDAKLDTTGNECTITVKAKMYVDEFNTANGTHTGVNVDDKTVKMVKDTNGVWSVEGESTVEFTVKCKPDTTPDLTQFSSLVKVECRGVGSHSVKAQTYGLIGGTYTGNYEHDGSNWLYRITLNASAENDYIGEFNKNVAEGHTLDANSAAFARDITWVYTNGNWELRDTVTIPVVCAPAAPTADQLKNLVSVRVRCADKDTEHARKTFALADGQFNTKVEKVGDEYICTLTLKDAHGKYYVGLFDSKSHSLKNIEDDTVKLVWVPEVVIYSLPTTQAVAVPGHWELYTDGNSQDDGIFKVVATCSTGGTTPPGGNNIGPAKNPYTKDEPKTVQSGKTFDAGIALYVGLGILSMTGGAVVIRRKKEF